MESELTEDISDNPTLSSSGQSWSSHPSYLNLFCKRHQNCFFYPEKLTQKYEDLRWLDQQFLIASSPSYATFEDPKCNQRGAQCQTLCILQLWKQIQEDMGAHIICSHCTRFVYCCFSTRRALHTQCCLCKPWDSTLPCQCSCWAQSFPPSPLGRTILHDGMRRRQMLAVRWGYNGKSSIPIINSRVHDREGEELLQVKVTVSSMTKGWTYQDGSQAAAVGNHKEAELCQRFPAGDVFHPHLQEFQPCSVSREVELGALGGVSMWVGIWKGIAAGFPASSYNASGATDPSRTKKWDTSYMFSQQLVQEVGRAHRKGGTGRKRIHEPRVKNFPMWSPGNTG